MAAALAAGGGGARSSPALLARVHATPPPSPPRSSCSPSPPSPWPRWARSWSAPPARSARSRGGSFGRRAGARGGSQPPPLRRLRRPRRDRDPVHRGGGVVELPDLLRRAPAARASRRRRRLRGDLREARRPSIDPAEQRLTFGAMLDVRRDGERVRACCSPSRNYYSLGRGRRRARLLRGRGDQRGRPQGRGRRRLLDGDAPRPGRVRRGHRRPPTAASRQVVRARPTRSRRAPRRRAALVANLQGLAIRRLTDAYLEAGAPVDFRVNVNPLVIWLWIGGAIGVAGGLIAIWPARRRRSAAASPTSTPRAWRASWAAPRRLVEVAARARCCSPSSPGS